MTMSKVESALRELGLELPAVAAPAGDYVPALTDRGTVYTSGQLPFVDGALATTGRVGDGVDVDTAKELAQTAALNALAAIKQQLGDLDRVTRVLRVTVFVNSAADFTQQPQVANGASELLGKAFGERGRHTRSAVGVAALPLGSPVELELTVAYEYVGHRGASRR
jgi:enamine deaminase RidA (YjgF/YER057c/UK114 family)